MCQSLFQSFVLWLSENKLLCASIPMSLAVGLRWKSLSFNSCLHCQSWLLELVWLNIDIFMPGVSTDTQQISLHPQ